MKRYIERYWRKATKEDTIKDPMMDARFRTAEGGWEYGALYKWDREDNRFVDSDGNAWDEAEVYDAPDPGEGYELIDITDVTSNDEWSRTGANWWICETAYPTDGLVFFRRKIKPVAITFPGIRSECRPLAYAEMVESTDIYVKDGKPLRAATDVGLLQGNTSIQYYREVNPKPGPMELKVEAKTPESFGTTTELQIIAEKKPETAEPVTFVAHPIQINEELEYCFQGKPIQFRSYAVLNEQGHYLQHLPAYPPQYAPEFRQAFTPLQLLQLSVRELGRNIRLRAVEPVDVDKLKQEYMQELKEKLRPKAPVWEPKRQKVLWKGREYYVLSRFHCVTEHGHCPKERVVLQDPKARDGFLSMAFADDLEKIPSEPQPEAPQPIKEPKYVPFTWEDREQLRGRVIAFTERNRKVEFRCEHFQHDSDGLLVSEFYAPWLCKNAVFTDTKEPVGKRVED